MSNDGKPAGGIEPGIYARVSEYPQALDHDGVRYSIEVSFCHPTIEPALVSERLGWVSDERDGGVRRDGGALHVWWVVEERRLHRPFFRHLVLMLAHLEGRRVFVAEFVESGGKVLFIVRLDGRANIGDVLPPDALMRLARMQMRLRVEVVPAWVEG